MTDIAAFVTVRAFTSVSDAQLACTVLQAAGLDARLGDEHLVSMQWLYSNAVGGVKLQVPADQVDEAREVLDTPAVVDEPPVPEGGDDACPRCGSVDVESVLWGRQPALISLLLAGTPLFPVRRVRRCRRCGLSRPRSSQSA